MLSMTIFDHLIIYILYIVFLISQINCLNDLSKLLRINNLTEIDVKNASGCFISFDLLNLIVQP